MERKEMRTIIQRGIPADQAKLAGRVEINSLINQGAKLLMRAFGGVVTTEDLTTDSDGLATLPATLTRLLRVVYDGKQLGKMDLNDITSNLNNVTTTKYYYPSGRTKIGTFALVSNATLTVHYEAPDSLPSITGTDSTSEGDLPTPDDWDQALINWVLWNLLMRMSSREAITRARLHKEDYQEFFNDAKTNIGRSSDVDTLPNLRSY